MKPSDVIFELNLILMVFESFSNVDHLKSYNFEKYRKWEVVEFRKRYFRRIGLMGLKLNSNLILKEWFVKK